MVDDLAAFRKGKRWSWAWLRGRQPQPVLVVDRHDKAILPREVEAVKIVVL